MKLSDIQFTRRSVLPNLIKTIDACLRWTNSRLPCDCIGHPLEPGEIVANEPGVYPYPQKPFRLTLGAIYLKQAYEWPDIVIDQAFLDWALEDIFAAVVKLCQVERIRPPHGQMESETLRAFLLRLKAWCLRVESQIEERAAERGDIKHREDFRSVLVCGRLYPFTSTQASIVRLLWEAWEQGMPDVDADLLLSDFGAGKAKRVRDLFRHNDAWGKFIVPGSTRGTYRLCL